MGNGIFGKMKALVGIEEIDDDEFEDDDMPQVPERKPEVRSSYTEQRRPEGENRVVPMSKPSVTMQGQGPFKMVVIEPKGFDDCPRLVDSLKARKPVIINLEKIESDVARKIFDFLSGATYALNGNVQKVANNIFIFAPESVDVTAITEHKGGPADSIKNPWK